MDTLVKYVGIARDLLIKHNLIDWTFAIDNVKSRLGQCRYDMKSIAISRYILNELKHDEIVDTIKHELAHALVGEGHGHDKVWKAKCRELGCRPLATYRTVFGEYKSTENPKFEGVCPTCNNTTIQSSPYGICGYCYIKEYMTGVKCVGSYRLVFEQL